MDLHNRLFVRSGPLGRDDSLRLDSKLFCGKKMIESFDHRESLDTEGLIPTWALSSTNSGFEQKSKSLKIQISSCFHATCILMEWLMGSRKYTSK